MKNKIEYVIRTQELLSDYSLEEFLKKVEAFMKKFPDGRGFCVTTSFFDENKSFLCLQCESPITKEEKQEREKELKEEKKERYQQYLKLKAEFEGGQK